jgi:hypothetical protein
MTCRRARSLLPLAAGGDLSSARDKRLQAHLQECRDCRRELELYQKSLEEMKFLARTEVPADWPESEWRRIMQLAIAQSPEKTQQVFGNSHRRLAWTLGSAFTLLLLVAGAILLFRGRNEKDIPSFPAGTRAGRVEVKEPAPQSNLEPAFRQPAPGPQAAPERPAAVEGTPVQPAFQAQALQKQNITNMVFVSSESGLTIHWVFNSEFEWKEK